jgi:hypothetical protein
MSMYLKQARVDFYNSVIDFPSPEDIESAILIFERAVKAEIQTNQDHLARWSR